jgi:hypothetical protein
LKHELSGAVIRTLFPNTVYDIARNKQGGFHVGIDDGDDEISEDRRGDIHIYSTIEVSICSENILAVQRLTPEEARKVASLLIKYADISEDVGESVEAELNEMEKFV